MDFIRNCHNKDHWYNVLAFGDCTCGVAKEVREESALEFVIQAAERKHMKSLDEHLARDYPEFVNHGKVVTEEEARPK